MKFKGNKLLIMLIVLLMAAALLSSVAFAEGETQPATDDGTPAASDEFQIDKSKTAAPTELTPDQKQTEVTLSLPSGEYKYVYDIVFVMDSSSSTSNNNIDFSTSVTTLMDSVKDKNVSLNVGVIKDRGRAFDTVSLVTDKAKSGMIEYNDDNKQIITDAISYSEDNLKKLSSGTNMHGGLKKADEWLSADTSVPNDHKFVFFLTDGKMYIWNDENDRPTTYYTQYQNGSGPQGTPAVGQTTGAYAKSAYKLFNDGEYYQGIWDQSTSTVLDVNKLFYFKDFKELYNNTTAELSSTDSKYDHYCAYADKQGTTAGGSLTVHSTTNGSKFTYNIHKNYYEFVPSGTYEVRDDEGKVLSTESWEDLNWLEAAPYEVGKNDDDTYTYDFTQPNPDFYQVHPDSLQKALYLTAHLWTDMVKKYNGAAIVYSGWSGGSGLEIAQSFNNWIKSEGISDYSAEISNEASVAQVFQTIKEDILYMVSRGVVTDEIVSELDLVKDAYDGVPFKLAVGDKDFAADADTEKENTWNFGKVIGEDENEDPIYEYSVTLKDDKTFVWYINVPVENANPVTLSYKLEWNGTGKNDTLTDTNEKATLEYWKSGSEESAKEDFDVPQVTYTESEPTPPDEGTKIKYVWLTYVSNGGTEYPKQDFPYYPPEYPAIEYTIDKEPIRPGYTFAGWYADEALTIPVTMVVMDRNRTVYAKWEKTETPGWLNDDDHYAYMIGYPDGLIQPNWNITRAEVATIFFRLLREEVREEYLTSTNSFSDVVEGQWFNTAISTVADMGIVNGYPDGTFKPNANITRAEFATIAARFDQLTKGTGNHFTDLDGHWAKEYIERAAKKGWVTGYPDGTFRPENLATRAEVATLVNRVLNRDPESPEDLLEGMVEWPDNMDVNAWYYLALQEASNTHEYERETKPTEVWTVLLENPDWSKYNY